MPQTTPGARAARLVETRADAEPSRGSSRRRAVGKARRLGRGRPYRRRRRAIAGGDGRSHRPRRASAHDRRPDRRRVRLRSWGDLARGLHPVAPLHLPQEGIEIVVVVVEPGLRRRGRTVAHPVRRWRHRAGSRDLRGGSERHGCNRRRGGRRQTAQSGPITYDLVAVARILAVGDQAVHDRAALLDRIAELRARRHRVQARVVRLRRFGLGWSWALGSVLATCQDQQDHPHAGAVAPPAAAIIRRRLAPPEGRLARRTRSFTRCAAREFEGPPNCGPSAGHRGCRRRRLDALSNLTIG